MKTDHLSIQVEGIIFPLLEKYSEGGDRRDESELNMNYPVYYDSLHIV